MASTSIVKGSPETQRRPDLSAEAHTRVLHVISGLGPGGAESVLFRLIRGTRNTDHEVICLGPREWYSEKLERAGVPVHHVNFASLAGAIPASLHLYRIVRASNAHVVQGWMYRGNVFGGLAARVAGKPVLWNLRCSDIHLYPAATRGLARLGGLLARWVPSAVLSCSAVSRQQHAQIGYGAVAGVVIPNGYDSEYFYPDEKARAATRKALSAGPETFLIGSIGRWDSTKGYPVLLRAIRLAQQRGVPLRLLLLGRGLDRGNADLEKMIDEFSCREFIELLGHRTDIPELARALDVHVLASITEGFPNVVAETMLSGTPNITTDAGDSRLIVDDTGWVVPPGSPEQLADAIERAYAEWSNSPQQWAERRTAACERISSRFALRQMVDTYENLWRQVADNGVISNPA